MQSGDLYFASPWIFTAYGVMCGWTLGMVWHFVIYGVSTAWWRSMLK